MSSIEWHALTEAVDQEGYAAISSLLTARECQDLIDLYAAPEYFRSMIKMERYGFGRGEYQYLRYPLPEIVETLRQLFYARLAPVAQSWAKRLRFDAHYPANLADFLQVCHEKGQRRPSTLILKYVGGDFNRLHQDLYGEVAFPFQLAICLNQPNVDFVGGEFLLTEQRPRMQTRAQVVPLQRGDAVLFANRYRPVSSVRGYSRANFRHGVSQVRSGTRHCLGIIFHDAA
jgi:hypothetical protein